MPSLFKTIVAVLCLVFSLCFAAPNARADSLFEYTVSSTDPFFAFSFTTVPIPLSDLGVALPTSDLSAFSLTGTGYRGGPLTGVILDAGGVGTIHLSFASDATANPSFFAAADYSSPGTYTGAASATMAVTAVATPEPSSLALMLSGAGLVFAMRKRWASGFQQAS
jgi:hypothetical protein